MAASSKGHVEVVHVLIKAHTNINQQQKVIYGDCALQHFVRPLQVPMHLCLLLSHPIICLLLHSPLSTLLFPKLPSFYSFLHLYNHIIQLYFAYRMVVQHSIMPPSMAMWQQFSCCSRTMLIISPFVIRYELPFQAQQKQSKSHCSYSQGGPQCFMHGACEGDSQLCPLCS